MNPNQRACVLVVDDFPDNLRTLSAILHTEGYKVRKATSGQMALDTVRSQPPDLILLDIKMPQMDGYEVCSTLKTAAETRSIPVIFLSALDETANKVKAFTVGGVDYITKPFQAEEVIARVESQLHLQRLSRELAEQNALLQHEIRTRQQTEVILQQEIGDRKLAEAALRESAIRLRCQNRVLMELARNPTLHQGNLPTALKAISQAITQNIAVERASIWLFDSKGTSLQCLELFEESLNQHSAGVKLALNHYPAYFQALGQEQLIVADDAHIDPRTREFSASYLTPLGITSMLDAPIRLGGQTVGVLCSEQVGAARHWTPEDQNFVRSAADLVSLALEARERQQAQEKLRQAAADLEQHATELMVTNTQLQLALDKLTKSEANLATAQRVAHIGNWEYDTLTQEINWSEELFHIFGLDSTQSEPTIAKILKRIHPDDHALWEQTVRLAIATGNSYEFDFRIIRPDGEVWHVEARGEAVFNKSAQVKRLFGTVLDITERKQREEALQASENLHRQMFEANTAVKLVTNPESGAIVDANPAAARFYGYKLTALKQMQIADLNILPCDRVLAKMTQTVSEQHAEFRFSHRLASGEIRDVAVYSSLITRQGQQLLYSIIHDITERTQAEAALRHSEARERKKAQQLKETLKQLKRTQSQLIQTEKMSSLGRIVAGVAHEINNPVNFIYGNLFHVRNGFQDLLKLIELYQQTCPNPTPEIQQLTSELDLDFLVEDWQKMTHSMQIGAERIQEIVLSLRSFSRLDEAELKPVDIHEGIDNTLLILQSRLKAVGKRPEIQVIKDYSQLPLVTCYASQLNQVFMNLLYNAIDAVETQPEPRRITIHTALIKSVTRELVTSYIVRDLDLPHRTFHQLVGNSGSVDGDSPPPLTTHGSLLTAQTPNSQSVVILITDNGSGMSQKILHKIFEPFFTTKPVGSGTGLGLSISHQIVVEKHGGQLSCISAPGYGTAFIVEIPILAEPGWL